MGCCPWPVLLYIHITDKAASSGEEEDCLKEEMRNEFTD